MRKFFRLKKMSDTPHGQALVEMAYITPILLFMLFGLFEVGWAVRGYLVLVNINREVTRRAVRPTYLDFSERNRDSVGYETNVLTYFGGQTGKMNDPDMAEFDILPKPPLPEALAQNKGYLTMSYFVAHTNKACEDNNNCNCDLFDAMVQQVDADPSLAKALYDDLKSKGNFTYDDIILHAGVPLYDYYTYTTYLSTDPTVPTVPLSATRLASYEQVAYKFALENAAFNCRYLDKSNTNDLNPSNNAVVVTELYYEQPQLFGFPILSVGRDNPLGAPATDPIFMYTKTAMRLMSSARKGIDEASVGPVCAPFPIVGSDALKNAKPTFDKDTYEPINIYDSTKKLNLYTNQWASWGGKSDNTYLKYEVQYHQMGLNEYHDSENTILDAAKKNDPVTVYDLPNDDAALDDLELEIKKWAGQKIIIPLVNGGRFIGAATVILNGEVDLNPIQVAGGNPVEPYLFGYIVEGAKNTCLDKHYCEPSAAVPNPNNPQEVICP